MADEYPQRPDGTTDLYEHRSTCDCRACAFGVTQALRNVNARINHIRAMIDSGHYDTGERLHTAVDRLLDDLAAPHVVLPMQPTKKEDQTNDGPQ